MADGRSGRTARAEAEAAGNLKPVFSHVPADWADLTGDGLRAPLQDAVQVKTIWVPYGA